MGAGRRAADLKASAPPANAPSVGSLRWRGPVAAFFVSTGVLHFTSPDPFIAIVPEILPAPRALVYLSGAAELAGGLGMLSARTARPAGWWLIATLLAIFPANVGMALAAESFPQFPTWGLWARLPLQALLIALVWRAAGRPWPARRRAA